MFKKIRIKQLFQLLSFSIFTYLLIFIPQQYMALNPGCCNLGYWYQMPYNINYFGTGHSGNIVTMDTFDGSGPYLNVWDKNKLNVGTTYLPGGFTSPAQIFQDNTGNVAVMMGNTINVYSGANLLLINTYTLPAGWVPYSNWAETTTIRLDGNNTYLFTLLRAYPDNGKIYVAKINVTGASMVGTPVVIMTDTDLFAQHSISSLEYNPLDSSLNVLYSKNIGTYNLNKYSVDFTASTVALDPTRSYDVGAKANAPWNWFRDLDIDADGNYYISTYNKIYVFDKDGNLSPKTNDFKNLDNTRVEIGSDGKLYQQVFTSTYPYQYKITSYGPKTELLVSGITNGTTLLQNNELMYTLKLSQAPTSNIAIDIVPETNSNIMINTSGSYASASTVILNTTNWNTGVQVKVKYMGGTNEKTLEKIKHSVNSTLTLASEECILGAVSELALDKKNALIDPPKVVKSVKGNAKFLEWEIWAANQGEIGTGKIEYKVTDPLPTGITMDTSSLNCTVSGTSVSHMCYFDNISKTVVWEGLLEADGLVTTKESAKNEVLVTFKTSLPAAGFKDVKNIVSVLSDTQKDGDIDSEDTVMTSIAIFGTQDVLADTGYNLEYTYIILGAFTLLLSTVLVIRIESII